MHNNHHILPVQVEIGVNYYLILYTLIQIIFHPCLQGFFRHFIMGFGLNCKRISWRNREIGWIFLRLRFSFYNIVAWWWSVSYLVMFIEIFNAHKILAKSWYSSLQNFDCFTLFFLSYNSLFGLQSWLTFLS